MELFYFLPYFILFQLAEAKGYSVSNATSVNYLSEEESNYKLERYVTLASYLNEILQEVLKNSHQAIQVNCGENGNWLCFNKDSKMQIVGCCQITENILYENNKKRNYNSKRNIICFKQTEKKLWQLDEETTPYKLRINQISLINQSDSLKQIKIKPFCELFQLFIPSGQLQIYQFQKRDQNINHLRLLSQKEEKNLIQLPKQCWFGCYECINQIKKCKICKYGYKLTQNQICQPQLIVYFLAIYLSFGFGTYQFGFILDIFISQFAYLQYYQSSDQPLSKNYGFIGTINRQKIFPIYLMRLFEDSFQHLRQFTSSITSQHKFHQTPSQFMQKQSSINYISNMLQIITFNLPFMLLLFFFINLLNKIFTKLQIKQTFLKVKSTFIGLIGTFLHVNGQYLMFMFWKQIKYASFVYFGDKINILLCICLTFFLLFISISIYPISCMYYDSIRVKKLFSVCKIKRTLSFIGSIVYGPNKFILIGTISSVSFPQQIKFILLLAIAIFSLASLQRFPPNYNKSTIYFQKMYLVLLCIFYLTKIISKGHKKAIFYYNLTYTIILIMVSLIILQIIIYVINYINRIVYFIYHRKTGMIIINQLSCTSPKNRKIIRFNFNEKIQDLGKFTQ